MNDVRSLVPHQLWRYLVGGALGCLVHLPVMAFVEAMPTRLDRFNTWSNGNVVSTKYAHDAAVGAIKHAQRAPVSGASTTSGVNLSKQIALSTRNGIVTATATQRISAAQIARFLRIGIGGPLGLALLAAPSVIALMDDADVSFTGSQWHEVDPGTCTSSPCYSYRAAAGYPFFPTPHQAAQSQVGRVQVSSCGTIVTAWATGIGASARWHASCTAGSLSNVPFTTDLRTPDTQPVLAPIDDSRAEQLLAAANPSPEVLRDLVQIGDVVPTPDPADATSISSPQPSPTKTTTKTNPDGSTETTECRTVGTVSGSDLRLSEQCTVTQRNPSGSITGTTTTTTDQADPQPQPKDEEEKSKFCEWFPNILACAEFGDPEGDDIPRAERSVSFTPQVLFGSGSCPADTTITAQGLTITVGNWSTWCGYITTYLKPMVLLLAAFAALMIVLKGVEE